jgi:hypothetical protein
MPARLAKRIANLVEDLELKINKESHCPHSNTRNMQ